MYTLLLKQECNDKITVVKVKGCMLVQRREKIPISSLREAWCVQDASTALKNRAHVSLLHKS